MERGIVMPLSEGVAARLARRAGRWSLWLLLVLAAPALAPPGWPQSAARAQGAAQERRIALVIGNARYRTLPLNNPENDARLIASRLRGLGFEVREHLNLGVREFRRVVRDFARRVQDDEAVALFYYAGHGVQIDGRNYLLPVDVDLRDEEEIKDESVDIDELFISRLEKARARARIVILDACRDNPFRGATRNLRTSGGLAEMAARGTLVAFSSAPGAAAEDGAPGTHSAYTRHLAEEMMAEGVEIEQVFKNVRVKVLRDTRERQVPWVNTSLTANFSFNPGRAAETAGTAEQARQAHIERLEAELRQIREALGKARAATEAALARQRPGAAGGAGDNTGRVGGTSAAVAREVEGLGQLEAQLERVRQALEAARQERPGTTAAAIAADAPPLQPWPQPADRAAAARTGPASRRDGSGQAAQCAELLQRASVGGALGAEQQAFLRRACGS